eukprot:NODE_772_length_1204_cov_96.335190_g732_i0.p1 GENE.NODE_772_length_1204_cov_96.335190_g732_i0~~NODE_772_length_1204_cov_96.335190_g732_i0.p1  ORF type:complete len:290 (+),score=31.99 NODE_772_length_1204_cov_96.335190_g732_i0:156-1025(+)
MGCCSSNTSKQQDPESLRDQTVSNSAEKLTDRVKLQELRRWSYGGQQETYRKMQESTSQPGSPEKSPIGSPESSPRFEAKSGPVLPPPLTISQTGVWDDLDAVRRELFPCLEDIETHPTRAALIRLVYHTPNINEHQFILNEPVLLGRSVDFSLGSSHVTFVNKVVSRGHAVIFSETVDGKDQVKIIDAGSSSGTFINGLQISQKGKPSKPVILTTGDTIRLGEDYRKEKDNPLYQAVEMTITIFIVDSPKRANDSLVRPPSYDDTVRTPSSVRLEENSMPAQVDETTD